MKRFHFPLDRVLRFRRLEMERVEARLSQLAYLANKHRKAAEQSRVQARQAGEQITRETNLRGADLRANHHWLARLESERLQALETTKKISERQTEVRMNLMEARRKVKLLEILRAKKLLAHKRESDRQLEVQVSEFFLAKRNRERQEGP